MMWCEIIAWCGWDYWRMWCKIIGRCGVRLLEDVGWDFAWCGVRLLHDVVWDYWRMWGEIIAGCGVRLWSGMRLLEDVGWDYWRMWGEIIGGCGVRLWYGVRLLEDVGWDYWRMVGLDYWRMWCEIIGGCGVRLLEDVCEATDENIHWAKERKLTISMPWLEEPNDPPDEGNPHPVTGCNEVYCLTDTLHERNCNIPAEKLRKYKTSIRTCWKLNTQVLEQINAEIGRSMYFLNKMSAYKQDFVLQLLMHLHNEKVNGKLLRTLTQKLGPLGKDSLSRLTCRYQ